ncbi:MAG: HAD family hydrolase, partial [Phycisphaerae bacterium]
RGLEKSAAAHPEHREADLADVLAQWANTHARGPGEEPLAAGSEPVQAAVEAIGRAWVGSLDPFPESAETLRTLKSRGYRMGLVSNCMIPRAYCLEELDRQGFGGLLDFHVISSEVGYRKPSPRIYEAALARAYPQGRPEDLSRVLFVGDSPAFDVIAPAAMGMKTALIECHKGPWPAEDYAAARPDLTLAGVAELIERL